MLNLISIISSHIVKQISAVVTSLFNKTTGILTEGDLISFTYTGSGAVNFVWDFGDGSIASTEQNPTHNYLENGIYDVKLTTYDTLGNTETDTQQITIVEQLPESATVLTNGNQFITNYTSTELENNKPPLIDRVEFTGVMEVSQVITIDVFWEKNHFANEATHEINVYTVTSEREGSKTLLDTLTTVVTTTVENDFIKTTFAYTILQTEIAKRLIFEATMKLDDTVVLNSESLPYTSDYGDIIISNEFNPALLNAGTSQTSLRAIGVPASWNTDTNPAWNNEGLGTSAIVGEAKPVWNAVDEQMEFTTINNHELLTPRGNLIEPVEIWMVGKLDSLASPMNFFGLTSGEALRSTGLVLRVSGNNLAPATLDESLFRIRWNGVNSFLDVNGVRYTFDGTGVTFGGGDFNIGSTNSSSSHLEGYIKEFHMYDFLVDGQDQTDMLDYFDLYLP